ncbi:unnamed protein product [Symbiodinium sp. KB8]|nr:unnamed protein product [Symbiodinium sp. KB8]
MPQELLPNDKLKFGATFTDHMLVCDWTESKGWHAPAIVPYGPLAIDPAASVLHYSLQCFEGMKAYRSDNDDILLFRPDMNMKRLNRSMRRLYLPEFSGEEMVKCIGELLKVDKRWIPHGEGYSLYIRPTGISTHVSCRPAAA